jgi:hypothetical protein
MIRPKTLAVRWLALLSALGALFAVTFLLVRPWYLTWGASVAEVRAALPGDELISAPRTRDSTTRAITIHAPAAEVWAWVAQLGQDRGGFYSYEILEDAVGCEMENADRVHPEFQHWKPGDKLWMYPPHKLGGLGHAVLLRHDPGRALVFGTRQVGTPRAVPYDGTWAFVVEPLGPETARLLVRGRAAGERGFFGAAFDHFVFEPIHFVMERKMLAGIALRAERGRASEASDLAQVALWTVAFLVSVFSAAQTVTRTSSLDAWIALVAFVASAVVFQILTFTQPPVAVSVFLVLAVAPAALPSPRSPTRSDDSAHDVRAGAGSAARTPPGPVASR